MTHVKTRGGRIVLFDSSRILKAISAAFNAAEIGRSSGELDSLVAQVVSILESEGSDTLEVEHIQDVVEQTLVENGPYDVAKRYILYRQKRAEYRKQLAEEQQGQITIRMQKDDGTFERFSALKVRYFLQEMSNLAADILDEVVHEVDKGAFDGIRSTQILDMCIMAASSFIEKDPECDLLAARLMRHKIFCEMNPDVPKLRYTISAHAEMYRKGFIEAITNGVKANILESTLAECFDLAELADMLVISNDDLINYLGMQTLYSRYLLRIDGTCVESIQSFWMRVAMGIAKEEDNVMQRAKEFYHVISSLRFVPSTPTLFHSGLLQPQLSSCYITTIDDDLDHIFKCIGDNARLSKWSGGVGNDWSNIRATGALIKSTKVQSQGVIPFLKIANDTTLAINRSGKRRGATCAYLEIWHYDIEDFADLRRNTGDDRRRAHDMSIAVWIPDLFMKRVQEKEPWTLFSPDEVPDLHDLYGKKFEEKYLYYESQIAAGNIALYRSIPAVQLWRKILTRLFETGHPWITFKDPCNIRSPQDHVGVVHSSNLCTEITLNTSAEETAVCNLGSINLAQHCTEEGVNGYRLQETTRSAIRMLDNVIDINFYPTPEAKRSNQKHRPIGLGIMGMQDALYKMRIPMDTDEAIEFCDSVVETISYYAILTSSALAKERGSYESFPGSKWDRGVLPIDTLDLLEQERSMPIEVNRKVRLDWNIVRNSIKKQGMRNSNTMAIAPTATISNISGCYPCNEPIYKNMYVKSNMSGEFVVINYYLINDLKRAGLWNSDMCDQIKYYDGNISMIANIPAELKELYKEAFDIDPIHHLYLAAVQGKWIDQSQSHNVFMNNVSGQKLHEVYMEAWKLGLKTTYYLRTLGATQIEKSTLNAQKYGYTQQRIYNTLKTDE